MSDEEQAEIESPKHIKQVSRIKHVILAKYLPVWERILGSTNMRLCYVDCYAGSGLYEHRGQVIEGSPLVAVRAAKDYLRSRPDKEVVVVLVEKDEAQRSHLDSALERVRPYGDGLSVHLVAEDSTEFLRDLLQRTPTLAPTFFFIDPYGHPLTVPTLNDILSRPYTEALITFMFYRINMDAGNPGVHSHLDAMFGHQGWRHQAFLQGSGREREDGFLQYFCDQIRAKFKLPFRIRFDVEDRVRGDRTKYYLIHASNHPKAVLLMKEVMWPLGDEEGMFDYSGSKQSFIFSRSPQESELANYLLANYSGRQTAFDQLREETWDLPFIEKHYRAVIKRFKEEGVATVTPVTSKTQRGLRGQDRVSFADRTKAMGGPSEGGLGDRFGVKRRG